MNSEVQVKLLRVLQESEITRLGSNKPVPVNVRIIAATHQDIQQAVADGIFRLDLYYRLNVITLKLPALRERPEDIPLLLDHFLKRANERYSKHCLFSSVAIRYMQNYNWPGNIRQLENLVERCVILSSVDLIDEHFVESGLTDDFVPRENVDVVEVTPQQYAARPYQQVKRAHREDIVRALSHSRGNKTQAARNLNMSARQLQYRIKKLNIQPEEFELIS
jgi:Nif-specific regulatory protein